MHDIEEIFRGWRRNERKKGKKEENGETSDPGCVKRPRLANGAGNPPTKGH